MNHSCKIDAHIPIDDGSSCECAYFIKNPIYSKEFAAQLTSETALQDDGEEREG